MRPFRFFLLVVCAVHLIAGCTEEDASPNNPSNEAPDPQPMRPLLLNFTATWDGNSGAYGVDAFKELIKVQDITPVSVHVGEDDPLSTAVHEEFLRNFVYEPQGNSLLALPVFTVNNDLHEGSSSTLVSDMKAKLAAAAAQDASAYLALKVETSEAGGAFSLSTDVMFTSAVAGDIRVAVYAIEDGVSAEQAVKGMISHRYVLRAAPAGFGGEALPASGYEPGDTATVNMVYTPEQGIETTNLVFTAVLYKRTGSIYNVLNTATIE